MNMLDRDSWEERGFFIERGLLSAAVIERIEREAVEAIRADPPADHIGERVYSTTGDLLIYPEKAPSPVARNPEDFIAKVFNGHIVGAAHDLAVDRIITDRLRDILSDDIDCFQS